MEVEHGHLVVFTVSNSEQCSVVRCLDAVNTAMKSRSWALLIIDVDGVIEREGFDWNSCSAAEQVTICLETKKSLASLYKLLLRYPTGWSLDSRYSEAAIEALLENSPKISFFNLPSTIASVLRLDLELTVAVTVHAAYIPFLSDCLASIDAQATNSVQKLLICDSCEIPASISTVGWEVIQGKWGTPNPGRNLAWKQSTKEWVIFFDADNIMPAGYLRVAQAAVNFSARSVAFVYPDIQYCDEQLLPTRFVKAYPWDYWWARIQTYFDTSAVWRISALESVGGFDECIPTYDDYSLVLKMSSIGWTGQNLEHAVTMREHSRGRRRSADIDNSRERAAWRCRSVGILTVFAGRRRVFDFWKEYIMSEDFPPSVSLYVVDNSGDEAFGSDLLNLCRDMRGKFCHVDYSQVQTTFQPDDGNGFPVHKHTHIANLYNTVLPRISEDLVYIVEDDVVPEKGTLRSLAAVLKPGANVGAVGAAYPSNNIRNGVCAALARDRWTRAPIFDKLPDSEIDVGFIGAGCTLYSNAALKLCLPVRMCHLKGFPTGWDGYTSHELRHQGFSIKLMGGIKCKHHFELPKL